MSKVLGIASLMLAGLFSLVFVEGWIELLVRLGMKEGVRIGFTLWPGNMISLGVLLLAFVFAVAGGKALEQS